MKKRKKINKWTTFDTVVIVMAALVILVTLYPMVYVVSCSFSDPLQVLGGHVIFLPKGFSTTAYELVIADLKFWRSMLNSVFYVVTRCSLMLFTTVAVAYPLTRPNLKFRKILTYYLLIPMYFGGGMIASFIVVSKLHMYNTVWALILPAGFGIWNIILCRTFMASLPGDLIDSALIDGSSQIGALVRVVLPLSKPVLAVILIYTIVGAWNSWFDASIYTTNRNIQPVQLYLMRVIDSTNAKLASDTIGQLSLEMQRRYQEMAIAGNQIKYAMIVITTLPIVAVYPMFQKHFTKGVMLGSLKG